MAKLHLASPRQGRINPPKAGRGHATPVQPVQRAKCWRLLNLEPRFEWYHVRARYDALIYRPYKETANVFLVTASILPSVLAVWELHALSPPLAGRYALGLVQLPSQVFPNCTQKHVITSFLLLLFFAKDGCHYVIDEAWARGF